MGGSPLLLKNVSAPEKSLAWRAPGREEIEPRRHRRKNHMASWRSETQQTKRWEAAVIFSSHDPREVLGIGKRKKIDSLEIRWPQPSGRTESFTDLPIDRLRHHRRGIRDQVIPDGGLSKDRLPLPARFEMRWSVNLKCAAR